MTVRARCRRCGWVSGPLNAAGLCGLCEREAGGPAPQGSPVDVGKATLREWSDAAAQGRAPRWAWFRLVMVSRRTGAVEPRRGLGGAWHRYVLQVPPQWSHFYALCGRPVPLVGRRSRGKVQFHLAEAAPVGAVCPACAVLLNHGPDCNVPELR